MDSIDGASSIEELNDVLTLDDFPFYPFVLPYLTLDDTRDVNIVNVTPNLVLVDPIMVGGTYYRDTDDPQKAEEAKTAVNYQILAGPAMDFLTLGYTEDEQNSGGIRQGL